MSFFLSENSEKRHLFTFDTFFPISDEPSKIRKSNPKSNPKLIKVVTLNSNRNSNPKSNPKLIKVVTLNSNRNSNPKPKITIRKGIKKGSHKLPNQHSKK